MNSSFVATNSTHHWTQHSFIKWPMLLLAYIAILIVSGVVTEQLFSLPITEQSPTSWPDIIIIALAELVVLSYLAKHATVRGWYLVLLLFVIYWGSKSFMMLLEAAYFLNIWQAKSLMSWDALLFAGFQNLIQCFGITFVVAALSHNPPRISENKLTLRVKPLVTSAIVYVVAYFLAGIFLAMPLGGEAFEQAYGSMTVPAWFPLFQFFRGLLWGAIIWLTLRFVQQQMATVIAVASITVFSTVQILHPNPYMLEQLRAAHFVELSVSMGVFVWITTRLLVKKSA